MWALEVVWALEVGSVARQQRGRSEGPMLLECLILGRFYFSCPLLFFLV